jgi:hypothetical protein
LPTVRLVFFDLVDITRSPLYGTHGHIPK